MSHFHGSTPMRLWLTPTQLIAVIYAGTGSGKPLTEASVPSCNGATVRLYSSMPPCAHSLLVDVRWQSCCRGTISVCEKSTEFQSSCDGTASIRARACHQCPRQAATPPFRLLTGALLQASWQGGRR